MRTPSPTLRLRHALGLCLRSTRSLSLRHALGLSLSPAKWDTVSNSGPKPKPNPNPEPEPEPIPEPSPSPSPDQVEHCLALRRALRLALTTTPSPKPDPYPLTRWNIVDVLWFGIMLTAGTMRMLYFVDPLRLDFSIFKLDYQVRE